MRWLRKLAGDSVEDERTNDRPTPAFSNDPFDELPFEMTLPTRWRPGLSDTARGGARDLAADAMFAAHDPESVDDSYLATLLVFWSEPVTDANTHLSDQEREFRSGVESDSSVDAYDLRRVTLPAGEALRFLNVREEAQIQYYLPTEAGLFAIWFTAPREELAARETEFAAIAQSFRLTDALNP